MDGRNIIDKLSSATPWVHVERPEAHEAFARGKFVFDVTEDGKLIDAFITRLKSKLGIVVVRPRPVYLPNLPGVLIYLVHLDRMSKLNSVKYASTANGIDNFRPKKTVQ